MFILGSIAAVRCLTWMVSDDIIKKKVLYGYYRKFIHDNLVSNSQAYSNHTVQYIGKYIACMEQNTETGL